MNGDRSEHGRFTIRRFPTLLSAIAILVLRSAVTIPRPSAAAQEATPIVQTEGVTFGEPDGQPLKLDVFLPPDGDQPQPAVILFHG